MVIIESIPYKQRPFFDSSNKVTAILTHPFVRAQLINNHKITQTPVTCLVDSGADRNLFPVGWAEVIGIPVKKGQKREYIGIGNSKLIAYSHFLTLTLTGTNIGFKTYIDFSYEQQIPLLGRVGFFNYFEQVIFDEINNKLTLHFNKVKK